MNAEYVRFTDASVARLWEAVDVFLDQAERDPRDDFFRISGAVYTQILAAYSRMKEAPDMVNQGPATAPQGRSAMERRSALGNKHLMAMDEVIREGLESARDFLVGLLETTGMMGYHQPNVGLVSTRFVLERVNEALHLIDGSPDA